MNDNDLREFCRWYRHHFGKMEDAESVLEVVKRMRDLSLITEKDKTITIV